MPDVIDQLQREYAHLESQPDGRAFLLAIEPYLNALDGIRGVRRVLKQLTHETTERLQVFVSEQNQLLEDAKLIRRDLADAAPEVDNSDMAEPDHASHQRAIYELDSFANFDRRADHDEPVGYPSVPDDAVHPGPVSILLIILRGRLRAAQYGEDAGAAAPNQRPELDDFVRRISNLQERYDHSVRRFRSEARTLPGLAYVRLIKLGTDLNPAPRVVEAGEDDLERLLNETLADFLSPKRVLRMLANGERMDAAEERYRDQMLDLLRGEAAQLQTEVVRRLSASGRARIVGAVREPTSALVVTVIGGLIVALVMLYVFGVGR